MPARIVKKYPNRRLYDAETSRYITQSELKDLLIAGAVIKVVDARTGEDRTREVLLQIVAEQEQLGMPLLSETMLVALIRFYGHPMQQLASRYLEASLGRFAAQSRQFTDGMQRAALTPAEFMNRVAQGGLGWLQQMQDAMSAGPDGEEDTGATARGGERTRKKTPKKGQKKTRKKTQKKTRTGKE